MIDLCRSSPAIGSPITKPSSDATFPKTMQIFLEAIGWISPDQPGLGQEHQLF